MVLLHNFPLFRVKFKIKLEFLFLFFVFWNLSFKSGRVLLLQKKSTHITHYYLKNLFFSAKKRSHSLKFIFVFQFYFFVFGQSSIK